LAEKTLNKKEGIRKGDVMARSKGEMIPGIEMINKNKEIFSDEMEKKEKKKKKKKKPGERKQQKKEGEKEKRGLTTSKTSNKSLPAKKWGTKQLRGVCWAVAFKSRNWKPREVSGVMEQR